METINKKHVDSLMQVDSFLAGNNIKLQESKIESNCFDVKNRPKIIDTYSQGVNDTPIETLSTNNFFYSNSCAETQKYCEMTKSKNSVSTCHSQINRSQSSEFPSFKNPMQNREEAFQPIFSTNYSKIPHEYLLDIWETLKSEEEQNKVSFYSIQKQKDINEHMRAILVDWIVDVHCRFKLNTETLFLTVSIIDRFLSSKQVLRSKLQLIGVTSLLIACKYEEILCPDIQDFVYVTDKAYSKQEILHAEYDILLTLNFDLTLPSPLRFFEIIALNFNFNQIEFTYGNYLLEFFLVDLKMNKYPSSLIALASAYIVMKINNRQNYKELYNLFNANLKLQCPSNSKTLKDCAREMFYLVQNAEQFTKLKAVYNKYSSDQNFYVSLGDACFRRT